MNNTQLGMLRFEDRQIFGQFAVYAISSNMIEEANVLIDALQADNPTNAAGFLLRANVVLREYGPVSCLHYLETCCDFEFTQNAEEFVSHYFQMAYTVGDAAQIETCLQYILDREHYETEEEREGILELMEKRFEIAEHNEQSLDDEINAITVH